MAPQRQRSPPDLNEDMTAEILLRVPPDEPAQLIRATVVCKLWLRIVSDPAFLRRYRAFHGDTPLLGFFYNLNSSESGAFHGFIPTTTAFSPPQPRFGNCSTRWIDSRHGRVLLGEIGSRDFVVWDPFSNHKEELQAPRSWHMYECNAVVLCATPRCDHRTCQGGPFLVVFVCIDDDTTVRAHVYSSESRSWYTAASAKMGCSCFDMKRAALAEDGIHWSTDHGSRILKYDLVEHSLSLICMPHLYKNVPVLMQNEDGSLGIAGVSGSILYVWWLMVLGERFTRWVHLRVTELKEIFSTDKTPAQANVICFAEGVEVFLITTDVGAFTFELKSGRVRKVGKPREYYGVCPFINFFTPDRS